ncbi:hypothetical protein SFUMM280S_06635 [Streptomyces fumanus]
MRAAEPTGEGPGRAERYTAAAEQELLAGRPDRARPLLAAARACAAPPAVRGRTELASGLTELRDGPVGDAHQTLLLAASLLAGPAPAQAARPPPSPPPTRPGPRATWKPVWPPSAPTGAATR